jgi:hypothetical protein
VADEATAAGVSSKASEIAATSFFLISASSRRRGLARGG